MGGGLRIGTMELKRGVLATAQRSPRPFRNDSGLAETHYAACPRPFSVLRPTPSPPPPPPSSNPHSRGTRNTLSTAFNLETNLTARPSVWQPDYSISPRQLVSPTSAPAPSPHPPESLRDAPGTALDVTGSIPPGAISSLPLAPSTDDYVLNPSASITHPASRWRADTGHLPPRRIFAQE